MGVIHLRAFFRLQDVRVAAVCSSDPKKLGGDFSAVAGNLNRATSSIDLAGVARYRTWQGIIEHPGLDSVSICLPTDMHALVAQAALNHSKDVLLEKPMALTTKNCEALLAAASDNKRILMVAHVLRFWPEYRHLRSFIESQDLMDIYSVQFERNCAIPEKAWQQQNLRSGGALLDLLIHDIDQAVSLFGLPERVSAIRSEGVDAVEARLHYASGLQIRIAGGWHDSARPFSMAFQVTSAAGTLSMSEGRLTHDSQVVEVNAEEAFEAEAQYFATCSARRQQPVLCPATDSALAVKVALLLDHSRSNGGIELACNP